MLNHRVFVFAGACLALWLSPLAAAQALAFLEIDDIPGEALTVGYEDQIAVTDWSYGVANVGDGPVVLPLRFFHRVDKASPLLVMAATMNTNLGTATLHVITSGGASPFEYVTLELMDARIVAVKSAGDSQNRASEEVTVDCSTFTLTYTEQNAQGGVAGTVETSGSCDG